MRAIYVYARVGQAAQGGRRGAQVAQSRLAIHPWLGPFGSFQMFGSEYRYEIESYETNASRKNQFGSPCVPPEGDDSVPCATLPSSSGSGDVARLLATLLSATVGLTAAVVEFSKD